MNPLRAPRRAAALVVATLAAALVPAAVASASTKVQTLPSQFVVHTGVKPGTVGNCDAIGFVQWAGEVKNATSYEVFYTFNGAEASKVVAPPFDDTYTWVSTHTVPAGSHWAMISKTWVAGAPPDDCTEYIPRLQALYVGPTRVEVTIDTTKCDAATAKRKSAAKALKRAEAKLKAAKGKGKAKAKARYKAAKAKDKAAGKAVTKQC